MKVILLEKVANLGGKYELADVKPGYARNFLFVRGLAEAVTKGTAKKVADLTKKREEDMKRQQEVLEKAFTGVKEAVLTFVRKANEEGHLYASVSEEELAIELGKVIGATIPVDHIKLAKPIKSVGTHDVPVELNGKTATFKVVVSAEV